MFGTRERGSTTGSGQHLVEFRAGRMNMIGKMVHPDSRKGLVYLMQSDDGLMHFCWKDRTTGKVEDDLIVFPDDFEFKRVEQCKTGRVYVLKFKTSSRRMFFWMQEPAVDKDEEYCRRVNELMNNPPSAQRSNNDNNDIQYMLNNMSQQQLMQLFGGVGQMGGLSSLLGSMNRSDNSSSRTSTPASNRNANSSSGGGGATTLLTPENNPSAIPRTPTAPKGKSAKSGNGAGSGSATTGGGGESTAAAAAAGSGGAAESSSAAGGGRSLNVDLSTAIVNSEAINDIIADPNRAKALSVHLPDSVESDDAKKQQIKDTIASPQFQQALTLFSNALQAAQLGPVVSQFELPTEAVTAAFGGNLEDFVKALEKSLPPGASMSPSPTEEGKEPKKDKDKEEPKKEEGSPSKKQTPEDTSGKPAADK